jgi:proteasome lid subunit RPN8/RPN11
MIESRDGVAVAVHRARNAAADPKFRYEMNGADQLRIEMAIDDAGSQIGAIYHSHTRSAPLPSLTDIKLARFGDTELPAFPGTLYLIVGLEHDEPDPRLWSIDGRDVSQVELQVEDE